MENIYFFGDFRSTKSDKQKRTSVDLRWNFTMRFFVFFILFVFGRKSLANNETKKRTGGKTMIRGAKKQMIVLNTGNSPYFDTAYFILKNKPSRDKTATGDILAEANRILCESAPQRPLPHSRLASFRLFCAGVLCGAVFSAGVLLLVFLL